MNRVIQSFEATVTEKGIYFNGYYYFNPIIIEKRWFEFASIIGGWRVRIEYFNENNVYFLYRDSVLLKLTKIELIKEDEIESLELEEEAEGE